ncbi:exopolysaccharide biosynthesis protein [Larsenimonas rhizosphaerae]|uniref:Exopolysaccharide biosynthesis protein n=1 Tax=Larsenimonas rhizosphaerae TaxID=2944682 RepID=A0AA41ZDD4_9GAMM|nr:exopolysaccharide biosynthesis protein [Larsenimonas rhizosphaerae]MCX2523262.1 exopolysaccharide biosynthesis protein [Larsenimonas rhizosphaerae]
MAERIKLTGLLEALDEQVDARKKEVTLGDVVSIFKGRGFGPLITLPALIAWLPTGAVPGVPSCCGIMIALVSIQLMLGKSSPWLPKRLREVSFGRDKLETVMDKVTPVTRRVDRLIKPRMEWIVDDGALRVLAAFTTLLGIAMIPLEVLPFAAAVPGVTLTLIGVGVAARDGAAVMLGLVISLIGGVWIATMI